MFEEKGFTRSKKSLRDLQKEIDELINKYENDKENLDLLEQLQTYDYEVEDLLKNIGAFCMKWRVRIVLLVIIQNYIIKQLKENGNIIKANIC